MQIFFIILQNILVQIFLYPMSIFIIGLTTNRKWKLSLKFTHINQKDMNMAFKYCSFNVESSKKQYSMYPWTLWHWIQQHFWLTWDSKLYKDTNASEIALCESMVSRHSNQSSKPLIVQYNSESSELEYFFIIVTE